MLFHSNLYLLVFLPLIFFLYFFQYKNFKFPKLLTLSIASVIFYSAWNISFLPLILFIIFFNFYFCKKIKKKKNYLLSIIFFNLLLLIVFKYTDFLIENINFLFQLNIVKLNLPFPLALSFVTFQMIAFLVDYYDGYVKKINIKDFFLFIIFFPQLIAGPIVRYNDMVVQYKSSKNKKININNIFVGLILIIIGFLKKTVLADNLGVFVDSSYIDTTSLSFYLGWLTSIAFTFQIYFDFSGYVDMATGSALLFNIKLPQNFDSPFKAKSLINFWQRWHMTLTSFLTNYIFNPCVRSLKEVTFIKMMFLIIMVFIICGFWHGPSWMYGIFGLMHGLGLAINHTFNKFFKIELNGVFSWFLTFNFVNFTFIFFRSKNLEQSFDMIKAMFDFNLAKLNYIILADFQKFILLISISFVLVLCFKNSYRLFDNYLKIKNNTDDYI